MIFQADMALSHSNTNSAIDQACSTPSGGAVCALPIEQFLKTMVAVLPKPEKCRLDVKD